MIARRWSNRPSWRGRRGLAGLAVALLAVGAAVPAHAAGRSELREGWLYVDGEPFVIKGVGYSPYRPGQTPRNGSVDPAVLAEDFEKIKQAGFNTIRTWKPLSPDELTLAQQHGLMVLQGVWIDPAGNLGTESYRTAALDIVRREAERAKGHPAVLALVIGNELDPSRVVQAGIAETQSLLRAAADTVRQIDPQRLVSYANWPWLSSLDHSMWDLVSFNVYPYEPVSVSHTFGYRAYLEYLKRIAGRKPFIVTELGLSVSPKTGAKPGYGGNSLEAQAREVVKLWDAAFEAGAQGACVFEWNDEWWKRGERTGDEQAHDADDPEEWFGITEFDSVALRGSGSSMEAQAALQSMSPTPRPVYDALKAYNHAVLVSPLSSGTYSEKLPISVYASEAVAAVRIKVGKSKWQDAARVSPHWWRAQAALPAGASGQLRILVEARNAEGKLLTQRERHVHLGAAEAPLNVTVTTDRPSYEVIDQQVSMQVAIQVRYQDGQPVPHHQVYLSITEPATKFELTHVKETDEQGNVTLNYPVWDAGLVTISAATTPDPHHEDHRVGAEQVVVVQRREADRRDTELTHVPSSWELRIPPSLRPAIHPDHPAFRLYDAGDPIVDYNTFGQFRDAGTPQYRYEITDQEGLAAAVGEGVYPNEDGLFRDPAYRHALREDKLKGNIWDFTYHPNPQLAFFRWAHSDEEPPGVKQFFAAMTLERAGLYQQATKGYYAVLVHFPDAVGWTEFETPWYVGKVAQDRLEALLRLHPELGLRLEGAEIRIEHGFDNEIENDLVIADPGQLVRVSPDAVNPPSIDLSTIPVSREIGRGKVRLRRYQNGHWQLLVGGKPWPIRGLLYQPTAVGESPDEGTLKDWMTADRNQNGKPDGPYDTFVDANGNGQQDPDEPTVGDFELMRRLGVNTLRLYHHGSSKPLLRQLYDQYGIMVVMGDLVGMYTVGSGAKWEEGTNYLDPVQRKRMFESVKQMVREYKKEPYILMWILGNENNYGGMHGIIGGVGNAAQYPEEYYKFINELAQWIHREDPNHPVAIANGEWLFVDLIAKVAPAIDVFGANVYRGTQGFGRSFYRAVQEQLDKPVFFTEFGCPAYQAGQSLDVGETGQALYHLGSWVDLEDNMAGRGIGNALGGVVFSWVDEWWKAGQPPKFSPSVQETTPNWSGPFPGGKNFEEWFGLTSQGDGRASPYLRRFRKAYHLYHGLWNTGPYGSAALKQDK